MYHIKANTNLKKTSCRHSLTWMLFCHRSHADDVHWDVFTPRRVWVLSGRIGLRHNLLSQRVEGNRVIFGGSLYPVTWEYCVCVWPAHVTSCPRGHNFWSCNLDSLCMWTFPSALRLVFIAKIMWPKWRILYHYREKVIEVMSCWKYRPGIAWLVTFSSQLKSNLTTNVISRIFFCLVKRLCCPF